MRSYVVVPRAVVVDGRHLLLVRDTAGVRAPSPARWHLPGGEVLAGETPQRATERLVKLRTGLTVTAGACLDAVPRRGGDPGSGRATQLLHLFFLCQPSPDADPGLLPAARRPLDLAVETPAGQTPPGHAGPPGGADWGWTDLASGIAALRHDIAGDWVIAHLEKLLPAGAGDPAALADGREA